MSDYSICWEDALRLSKRIRAGECTVSEVTQTLLDAIKAFNEPLNAVVTLDEAGALERARDVEQEMHSGALDASPLAGVPYLAKDLDITAGIRTTFGSAMHSDYVPKWDMFHIARLREAGCVLLGKTNTPENGLLPNTYNDVFGVTRNPWNTALAPGGSSGGSAAAVSAGFAPLSTGSDAGGSIRVPASLCGVFGFKPSFGAIPFGPKGIGISNTVSHLGPLTRCVADAAAMMDVMAGGDERDWISLPKGPSLLDALDQPFTPRKIAYSCDLGYAPVDPEVQRLFEQTIEQLQAEGWPLEEAHPGFDDPEAALDGVMRFEFGTFPMLTAGAEPEHFAVAGEQLKNVVEARRNFTIDDLWKAYQGRKDLCASMGRFFDTYDLLLTPTLTRAAFEAGIPWPEPRDPPEPSFTCMVYPFNLTGDPACSIPMGLTADGLPAGLQIVGPRHSDHRVLQAACHYERIVEHTTLRPPASVGS